MLGNTGTSSKGAHLHLGIFTPVNKNFNEDSISPFGYYDKSRKVSYKPLDALYFDRGRYRFYDPMAFINSNGSIIP